MRLLSDEGSATITATGIITSVVSLALAVVALGVHTSDTHRARVAADLAAVAGATAMYRGGDACATAGRTAELGYRVAQHVAGRGVATATVRELCRLAAAQHGLHTLRAATSHRNVASQKVLTKAGFVAVGPADPAHLGGKPGFSDTGVGSEHQHLRQSTVCDLDQPITHQCHLGFAPDEWTLVAQARPGAWRVEQAEQLVRLDRMPLSL